jgi:ABC-type antimicrobial peptide transport system, permease component
MGAGTLSVSVSGSDLKSGLNAEDLTGLTALKEVDGVTPNVSLRSRVSRGGTYKTNVSVSGKNHYFFYRTDGAVTRGRPVHPTDEENMTFVCLITQDMVSELFFGVDPLGETMYVDGIPFTVIGILSDTAQSNVMGVMSGSANIIIPYTTALKMNNSSDVTSLTVYLSEGTDSKTASAAIEETMDAMFSYEDDCFTVTAMSSIEDTMNTMLSMVSSLLAGIASIALIVGGIGIMNMMLTTVTERTVEIGLKKALGAMPWQIQLQFLIESFLLSMIGGIIGVITGVLLSMTLCRVMETGFSLSGGAIALGVGFSAAVGIVFGWVPARKASKLNPIDALRAA